jgi:hypothetical protein
MNTEQLRADANRLASANRRREILAIINSAEGEAHDDVELRQVMALLARGTRNQRWFEVRGIIP